MTAMRDIFRYGISEQDFLKAMPSLQKNNASSIRLLSLTLCWFMLIPVLIALFFSGTWKMVVVYMVPFGVYSLFALITTLAKDFTRQYVGILSDAFFLCTIAYSIAVIIWFPEGVSSCFLVCIAVIPLVFTQNYLRTTLISLVSCMLFSYCSYQLKNWDLALFDSLNAFSIFILVLFFQYYAGKNRIRNILTKIEKDCALTQLRQAHAELKFRAEKDELSGLYNRRTLIELTNILIARMETSKKRCALGILDLDNFKHINDTYGHITGDGILKNVGAAILDVLRSDDIASRIGGDEFIFVLSDIETPQQAQAVARRILDRMQDAGRQYGITVASTIGLAITPQDGKSFDELYHIADNALYAGKRSGKHTVTYVGLARENGNAA